ncbi:hypothetical protein HYPSUDRAFT_144689 [Hypholoma sublateritium FD-334 SS-4]|uniref:TIGR04076 family protein n=1 Tax=Hypholoma sublateritium (strain FD-334 SS-4) TaxID=945553 RepID=A0A0D2NIH3_HYPSF|nr:hypothetical protein HYPSUDRAFT_144689 [Hypholoma sublateritium FD-334 SS-4]
MSERESPQALSADDGATSAAAAATNVDTDDTFELFDLRVEVVCPPGARILCGAKPGDHFVLRGEMLHLPPEQGFSIYSLAAVLPLLAAKQRPAHAHDWMASDAEVACPDPLCGTRLRITRTEKRVFSHGEVSGVPLRLRA